MEEESEGTGNGEDNGLDDDVVGGSSSSADESSAVFAAMDCGCCVMNPKALVTEVPAEDAADSSRLWVAGAVVAVADMDCDGCCVMNPNALATEAPAEEAVDSSCL